MLKILIFVMLICTSCASNSVEWGPWKVTDIPSDQRIWRYCSADLDGEALHRKGHCYISQECRSYTTIFRNVKTECRNLPLFCAWGDIECMEKNGLFNKIIVNKEK